MEKANLIEVLRTMDVNNDAQWTAAGEPKLDALRWLAKDQSISREDVNAAAPGFSRTNPALPEAPAKAPEQTEEVKELPKVADQAAPRTANDTTPPASSEFESQPKTDAEVEVETEQKRSEADSVRDELVALEQKMADTREAVHRANQWLVDANLERDELQHRLNELDPPPNSTGTIRAYLRSQVHAAQERHAMGQIAAQAVANAMAQRK